MPSSSEKPTALDLSAILEGLLEAGIKFILVGGLAAVVQGAPVTTMDVDIVHYRSSANISKLIAFLKSINAIYRRSDDKVIGPCERDISQMGHFLFTTRFGPLDVLAFIEQGKVYEDLLEHTIEIELRGHKIRVLNLKTLVELKKTSRDSKDKQRLTVLEETLRQVNEQSGIDLESTKG
jgi:predicted nucleotidyltransferase